MDLDGALEQLIIVTVPILLISTFMFTGNRERIATDVDGKSEPVRRNYRFYVRGLLVSFLGFMVTAWHLRPPREAYESTHYLNTLGGATIWLFCTLLLLNVLEPYSSQKQKRNIEPKPEQPDQATRRIDRVALFLFAGVTAVGVVIVATGYYGANR